MSDDEEFRLRSIAPRSAPSELRERVLNAVAKVLSTKPSRPVRAVPSWDFRIGGLVAMAVLSGVLLNLWAVSSTERQLAQLAGPRPVPRQVSELVEIVESVTGCETGAWVQQRLVKAWRSRPICVPHLPDWEQLIYDLEINQDWEINVERYRRARPGETGPTEKNPKIPRQKSDRAVFDHRRPVDHECDIHFDSWSTA